MVKVGDILVLKKVIPMKGYEIGHKFRVSHLFTTNLFLIDEEYLLSERLDLDYLDEYFEIKQVEKWSDWVWFSWNIYQAQYRTKSNKIQIRLKHKIQNNNKWHKGQANCLPNDIYDFSVGRKIATLRAMQKLNDYELKQLTNPTPKVEPKSKKIKPVIETKFKRGDKVRLKSGTTLTPKPNNDILTIEYYDTKSNMDIYVCSCGEYKYRLLEEELEVCIEPKEIEFKVGDKVTPLRKTASSDVIGFEEFKNSNTETSKFFRKNGYLIVSDVFLGTCYCRGEQSLTYRFNKSDLIPYTESTAKAKQRP